MPWHSLHLWNNIDVSSGWWWGFPLSVCVCVSRWQETPWTLRPVTWWWATHLRRTTRSVPMADQHRWGHESVHVCGSSTPRHSFSLNTQTKFVRAHTTDGLPPWGKMSDQTWRWNQKPSRTEVICTRMYTYMGRDRLVGVFTPTIQLTKQTGAHYVSSRQRC